MIINNFKKSKIKILLDIEDIKNFEISLNEWLISPEKNLDKILKNFNELKTIIESGKAIITPINPNRIPPPKTAAITIIGWTWLLFPYTNGFKI